MSQSKNVLLFLSQVDSGNVAKQLNFLSSMTVFKASFWATFDLIIVNDVDDLRAWKNKFLRALASTNRLASERTSQPVSRIFKLFCPELMIQQI